LNEIKLFEIENEKLNRDNNDLKEIISNNNIEALSQQGIIEIKNNEI
jgi:hypothetical protein